MNSKFWTVEEFMETFRDFVGDTSHDIEDTQIISFLNVAARKLAREDGLDRLFTYHKTNSLAQLNADGTKAASWIIDKNNIGTIFDVKSLAILDSSDCNLCPENLCYLEPNDFRMLYPFPEINKAGKPCHYTLEYYNGATRLVFDRPIVNPVSFSMVYTASPPRIRLSSEFIPLPDAFIDVILDVVRIFSYQESSDWATSRALYEDYDKTVAEIKQLLARRKTSGGNRKVRRTF